MDQTLFTRRPWQVETPLAPLLPTGMLRRREASLLFHLARDYYGGYGDIVDAGAFLGSSSLCLAAGLNDNARVLNKHGRLHAFDLFEVWHEQGQTDDEMALSLRNTFGLDIRPYESTLDIYMRNLGAFGRLVQVHKGDILKARWDGRPLEIFFIDICKTREIMKHLISSFYPSLIPGLSVVVHQDYHHPLLPFIHVAQERLNGYFEVVEPKANDSAAFRLVDRIPDRLLLEVAEYAYTEAEELRLMDAAVERMGAEGRHVQLAKVMLLREHRRFDEARALLQSVERQTSAFPADRHLPLYVGMVQWFLAQDVAHGRLAA